jgi:hypothetical protein
MSRKLNKEITKMLSSILIYRHIVQILGSILTITLSMVKPCLDRSENTLIIDVSSSDI